MIHIGSGQWIIIDCCSDESGHPAPLTYLNKIGVSADNVKIIIATHWHDDHIKCMSNLLCACKNAKFCMSNILEKKEFLAFIDRSNRKLSTDKFSSGVEELSGVIDELETRGLVPAYANQDKRIGNIAAGKLAHSKAVEIWTLSPTDTSISRFLTEIASKLPKEKETKRRAASIKPNETSVVVYISIGDDLAILLGADLEEKKYKSWSEILSSSGRPMIKASLFKIPHHGSITAHHDDVWSEMLNNPICVLTPWNRSSKLPAIGDVKRILHHSDKSFSTKNIVRNKRKKRDASVQKKIDDISKSVSVVSKEVGIVRSRIDMSVESDWSVNLFSGACKLDELL